MTEGIVGYGFVTDFKGSDTLLFLSDRVGFRRFAHLLRDFAVRPPPDESGVQPDESLLVPHGETRVVLVGATEGILADTTQQPDLIALNMGRRDAVHAANLLDTLADSSQPAHQYLETSGAIQILASLGEYDERVFGA